MWLAQGPQRSDDGEARTRGPSVSSQALYHWATALPITIEYIFFIQLIYNKNDHLTKQSIFVRCLMSSLASITHSPLDPRRLLYMLYMIIATCHCPKGILGLGGKASKNKLKDTSFTFPVTNVTILSIFRTHAQEGYCKSLEMNSTSILYSLALLPFEN